MVRFAEYDHLKAFMASGEREEFLKKSEPMVTREMSVQEMHGLDSFFTLPDHSSPSITPARYKMAILTFLVLYPSLLFLNPLITAIFRGFPRPLLILFSLIVLVPFMTYFLMPWVTRLFRFWLYPKAVTGK